jgi:hypothetical protein
MSRNRNLVIVRCGDESLHTAWIGPDRNWDLAISYFGPRDDRQFSEADYTHRFKGGKWNGIFAFFQAYPKTLEQYDFFWLPDDDIEASCKRIEMMFETMATRQFELAQPSLSKESYLSHLITLHNPFFVYRRVNFVELMVPVFSQTLLVKTLPLFENTRTGFGMDYVWHRFTTDPTQKVAVLDNVEVRHTRPVGGALHKMLETEGLSPAQQELSIFLKPYGDCGSAHAVLGGQVRIGFYLGNAILAQLIAAVGWSVHPFGIRRFTKFIPAWRFWVWIARNFTRTISDSLLLTPIEPALPVETASSQESKGQFWKVQPQSDR